ncbi:MAG: hypothetical protein OEU36_20180 [Gammaproteobacteria bacterium]|nr:hypothetical protein [Gammaproteobacteria bacterium]
MSFNSQWMLAKWPNGQIGPENFEYVDYKASGQNFGKRLLKIADPV